MTISIAATTPVPVTAYHEGEGFVLRVGGTACVLTADEAAKLGAYLNPIPDAIVEHADGTTSTGVLRDSGPASDALEQARA